MADDALYGERSFDAGRRQHNLNLFPVLETPARTQWEYGGGCPLGPVDDPAFGALLIKVMWSDGTPAGGVMTHVMYWGQPNPGRLPYTWKARVPLRCRLIDGVAMNAQLSPDQGSVIQRASEVTTAKFRLSRNFPKPVRQKA